MWVAKFFSILILDLLGKSFVCLVVLWVAQGAALILHVGETGAESTPQPGSSFPRGKGAAPCAEMLGTTFPSASVAQASCSPASSRSGK